MLKYVTRTMIDDALQERDLTSLTNWVRGEGLSPEVREYLADVLLDLLTGNKKFPKRRPPKRATAWKHREVAHRVWGLLRYGKYKKKIAAVRYVADELGCSDKTVWNCLASTDGILYELKMEKLEYDAMCDAAYEARYEAARASLVESQGDREFTDEEIEAEAEEMDKAWEDIDP